MPILGGSLVDFWPNRNSRELALKDDDILTNEKNTIPVGKRLVDYHKYLIENDYNPNYYESQDK